MQHFASLTAFALAAIMAASAAPTPVDQDLMARECQIKVNTGGLSRRCIEWQNAGLTSHIDASTSKRDSVGIANGAHGVHATFRGTQFPSEISARDDTNVGVANDATNSDLDFSGANFQGMRINGKRDSVGIANGANGVHATFRGTQFPSEISARDDHNVGVANDATNSDLDFSGANFQGMRISGKRGDVGILNNAEGDYNFDGATFGSIKGTQYVNKRADGDVGVKNGATGGGDYHDTVWGPQVGDSYIGYSTVHKRADGDVGVKNGATGGGDYHDTVWGPQVGDSYIGYSTVHKRSEDDTDLAEKRDGNNDADPCPGVPVGPSVGTTYMPTHPSKRCSSTPIPAKAGGIVYTRRGVVVSDEEKAQAKAEGPAAEKQLKQEGGSRGAEVASDRVDSALASSGLKRDGNNDADPCPGVPVGPSVGTTYMPTHPSKRCSSTPIAPKAGGVVYTRRGVVVSDEEKAQAKAQGPEAEKKLKQEGGSRGAEVASDRVDSALAGAGLKRDGNNDADPCPGVPVGPSVGTTYMPTHPSKRCSSTPIAPKAGGVVYTRDVA